MLSRFGVLTSVLAPRVDLRLVILAVTVTLVSSEGIADTGQVNQQPPITDSPMPDTAEPYVHEGGEYMTIRPLQGLVFLACAAIALTLIVSFRWYRLDHAPTRSYPCSPLAAFILVVAMMLLGYAGAILAGAMLDVDAPITEIEELGLRDQARLMLGVYLGQAVGLIAFVAMMVKRKAPEHDQRPGATLASLIGAGGLLLFMPLVVVMGWIASFIAAMITGRPPDAIAHETLATFVRSDIDFWFVVMTLLVVVAAPVMEEVIYRGLLQSTLRQLHVGPWPSIIAVSLIFTLMHVGNTAPHALVVLFVLSLGFGWVYAKTGRLAAPIVMHMLFNAANLAIAMLTIAPDAA